MGSISLERFMGAADQIASDLQHQTHFTPGSTDIQRGGWSGESLLLPGALIDTTLWPQPAMMRAITKGGESIVTIDGQGVADRRRSEIAVRARRFEDYYSRKPYLAVVEVLPGEAASMATSLTNPLRKQSSPNTVRGSWLDKVEAGAEMGVEVERITLSAGTPIEEVISAIRRLNRREGVDGVLMELPDRMKWGDHLDARTLLAEVDPEKCIDGMSPHSIATLVSDAAAGTRSTHTVRATTPGSVMDLLEGSGVTLTGRHAVVVGNSRLCGQPIALMLQKEGAAVSVVTSSTPRHLRDDLCGQADVIVSVVGEPGIITEDNARPGAVVINVGTQPDTPAPGTPCSLLPDVALSTSLGHTVSATPGGVGPNPVMILFENLIARAEHRAAIQKAAQVWALAATGVPGTSSEIGGGWDIVEGECLRKSFRADSFETATSMLKDISQLTRKMNHHPLATLSPATGGAGDTCFNHGCVLELELRSIEAGGISAADIQLAACIDKELA